MVRVFANGPGDQGSIPGQVTPNTKKMVLDAYLFNTRYDTVWIKGKWSTPEKGVVPFPTPWCSRYWKGSLWVTIDYNRPTYFVSLLSFYKDGFGIK